MLLAYIGPDTFLPMTSLVAAFLGCAVMCGKCLLVVPARAARSVAWIPGHVLRMMSRR